MTRIWTRTIGGWSLLPIRLAIAYLLIVMAAALLAGWLPLTDPMATSASDRLQPPSRHHWLGTDELGRDILNRIVFGARRSLAVGVVSVALAAGIGTPLGLAAGYFGAWTDRIVNAIVETAMAFPTILMALVLVSVFGAGLFQVMIAIGVSQIPAFARQARASTLFVREQDFVHAARATGATTWFILYRHVQPNVMAPILVLATMGLASAILDAAGMSFLGLTGDPNTPEWGSMLTADRARFFTQPWLVLAPGLAITSTVLAFNLLGDAARDALDPRLRRAA